MNLPNEQYQYLQMTASGLVKNGAGCAGGIFVSSASGTPTITVYDSNTGSGNKIVDTFTPVAATPYPMPAVFTQGMYIVIGGTVSLTAYYN
ncbi:MAG: hypothetical protein KGL39_11785 [Patescibacteria group bacterium]|nr:hypothetical protein [Patescibacteria group bacterium]